MIIESNARQLTSVLTGSHHDTRPYDRKRRPLWTCPGASGPGHGAVLGGSLISYFGHGGRQ